MVIDRRQSNKVLPIYGPNGILIGSSKSGRLLDSRGRAIGASPSGVVVDHAGRPVSPVVSRISQDELSALLEPSRHELPLTKEERHICRRLNASVLNHGELAELVKLARITPSGRFH